MAADAVLDLALTAGPLPLIVTTIGALGLILLVLDSRTRSRRRFWTRVAPGAVTVAAVILAMVWAVLTIAAPFPDPLPTPVWAVGAVVCVAVSLAVPGLRSGSRRARATAGAAVVTVLLAGGCQINILFDQFPTLRAALSLAPAGQVAFVGVSEKHVMVSAPRGRPLNAVWRAPAGIPDAGVVTEVAIPSSRSHFLARNAWIYLPPAYQTVPRARLPVLVLVSGQPGTPRDWLDGGRLTTVMDEFARDHAGLAPVVVMPDALGGYLANPLCLDSRLGHAATYLTVDVPAWIRANLQVEDDPRHWAIGGLSAGGTCALQLATTTPAVYPTFLDISGQMEPTLGDRSRTVTAAFGGDARAYAAVNPLDLLSRHRYPNSAGMIVVGNADQIYRPQEQLVAQAARRAGMQILLHELPGAHDWRVWSSGLKTSLPWLTARLGLIA